MKFVRSLLASLLFAFLAVVGVGQSFTTSIFRVDAEIKQDRTLRIAETIEVNFTKASHGIVRWVPVDYRARNGEQRSIGHKLISVTQHRVDEEDGSVRANLSHTIDQGWWKLRVGDAGVELLGRVRYELVYELTGTLTDFEATATSAAHSELVWNFIPVGWATEIDKASVSVRFPSGGEIPPRVRYIVGPSGAKDGVEIYGPGKPIQGKIELLEATLTANSTEASVIGPLPKQHGMMTSLAMSKGSVDWEGAYVPQQGIDGQPTASDQDELVVGWGEPMPPGMENLWNPLGLLPFGILAALALLFRKLLGLPKQGPLVTRFEPPDGIGPIEGGYLIDGAFHARDLTAGIISLAQKGVIRLHLPASKTEPDSTSYTLELLDGYDRQTLTNAEQNLRDALEGFGPMITPEQLRGNFRLGYQSVQRVVQNNAISLGLMRANHGCVQGCGCVSAILVALLLGAFTFSFGPGWVMLGSFVGLLLLGLVFLTSKMHTAKGAAIQHELKGLREFISRAQKDELNSMSARMPLQALFETLLPYAVAFGYAQQWTTAFRDFHLSQPEWIAAEPSYSYDAFLWSAVLADTFTTFDHDWTNAMTPAALFENKGFPTDNSWSDGSGSSFASGDSSFTDYGSSDGGFSGSDSVGDGGGGGGGDSW
ncbi:MAG: DUF2207 domain-containing protein [Fimbriimonadaceae bacterium]|nr:DUF2207 domain-containing protein [Fimbriimonadaceae bacterium]